MSVIDQIAGIFESLGIPRHVWEPIARQESELNPAAWNQNGEDSRGLFQINLAAHPEYAGLDLFDPLVNAQVAARDFIGPAYREISWNPDPGTQAAYVWQYGIRPNWEQVQQQGKDVVLMETARALAGTSGGSLGNGAGGGGQLGSSLPAPPSSSNPLKGEFWQAAGFKILFALILVILFLGGFWALAKAFGADEKIKQAVEIAVKGGVKAATAGAV